MVLFWQHFRSEIGALLGWSLTLIVLSVAAASGLTILAQDLGAQIEQMSSQMPPELIRFFGGGLVLTNLIGVVNAVILSSIVPLLITIWTALAAVGTVSADREHGTLEFLLALPVRRWRLLAERWLAYLVQLLLLYVAIFVGAMLGAAFIGEPLPAFALVGALGLGALAQAALGGMVLLLSLAFRDQTKAVLIAVAVALALFFLPIFVEQGSSAEFVRQLSPVTHAAAPGLLSGGAFPWSQALVLLVWAVGTAGLAILTFVRQEV